MRPTALGAVLVLLLSSCEESVIRVSSDGRRLEAGIGSEAGPPGDGPRGEGRRVDGAPVAMVTVQGQEIQDLLANPGMGWQTFHHLASNDLSLAGLPSGSAYYRWNWRDLQPTEASIKTSVVTDTLAKAKAAGQTLMFRVMTTGDGTSYNAPDWLAGTGCKIWSFQPDGAGPTVTSPDLDDTICFDKHKALLDALAKALAADAENIQVDIGSVGLWGEWHFSGTQPKVPLPSLATKRKLVDLYFSLFPKSPLMALIGDVEALTYATSKGAGWRADCFGDYGFFSSTWNHMDHMYKQNVAAANAGDAWKKGPVAWESCGVMSDWVSKGFDVQKIFTYGLDLHGSFMNNKSSTLPSGTQYRTAVEAFIKKLGFRFVLRELRHPEILERGRAAEVTLSFENLGVAPCYHGHRPALQLTPKAGGQPIVIASTTTTVKTFLPGPVEAKLPVTLDAAAPAGSYAVAVGIVDTANKPVLKLAIEGRDASGWYPLSTLTVK